MYVYVYVNTMCEASCMVVICVKPEPETCNVEKNENKKRTGIIRVRYSFVQMTKM